MLDLCITGMWYGRPVPPASVSGCCVNSFGHPRVGLRVVRIPVLIIQCYAGNVAILEARDWNLLSDQVLA